jgi:hypothetical protein
MSTHYRRPGPVFLRITAALVRQFQSYYPPGSHAASLGDPHASTNRKTLRSHRLHLATWSTRLNLHRSAV